MSKTPSKKAVQIVEDILDALGDSTWRDNHPYAYDELLYYRGDLEDTVDNHVRPKQKR